MSITLSYDLLTDDSNHRTYVRSMFERFGWKRLGGSVFRYDKGTKQEDWLNEVAPSIMLFRSYVLAHDIQVRFFTLDAMSVARIDHSDPGKLLGAQPIAGRDLELHEPTNKQSSVKRIRRAVDEVVSIFAKYDAN